MTLLMRLIAIRVVMSIILQVVGFVVIGLTTSWWSALGVVLFAWGYKMQFVNVHSLFEKI